MQRPTYESLDGQGRPYDRPARVVGELPRSHVDSALASATLEVSKRLNIAAQRRIPYGAPVFVAFGLNRPQAKNHPAAALLLTKGDRISLDLCPEYN